MKRALYIVCDIKGTEKEQFEEVLDAYAAGDWWTSSIAAHATMDQWNAYWLERTSDEDYAAGNFTVLGTFEFEFKGLADPREG